jgi:Uncharacterized membrane protein, required for colicin V production
MNLGWLDYALLVIMGYFFLRGLFRGVVKEIVAVLGIFVAFWVASLYWPLGEEHLKPIFDQPGQRGVISFFIIFVVVYFFTGIISIFFDKIIKMTISPVLSAIFGSVVGLTKGILFCAVLMTVPLAFLKPDEKFFTSSELWPHLQPLTNQAKAWMPETLQAITKATKSLPPALGGERPSASTGGTPAISLDSVDWNTIKNLLATRPNDISPAWQDKLRNISGPEGLSKEDLKRFISEHQSLFAQPAPVAPAGAQPTQPSPTDQVPGGQTSGGSAPTWPQPATE